MNTTQQWICQATAVLANGVDPQTSRLDAELLVSYVTGHSRAQLFAFPEHVLEPDQTGVLNALLQQRLDGKPLSYITGVREFWSLPLQVTPAVLIPRPDTEILVERVLALEHQAPTGCIIELGTGSGAIAIALAQELTHRAIIAVEKQSAALAVAHNNAEQFGRGRIQLVQGHWLDAFDHDCAAMIISNPPYLAENDPHLPQLSFEPQNALISGASGLEDIEHIIQATRRVGKSGCRLVIEHGHQQAAAVQSLLKNYTYTHIRTERDLGDNDRITYATMNTGTR